MLLLKKRALINTLLIACFIVVQCNRSSSPAVSEEAEPEDSGTARITALLGKTMGPEGERRSFVERCILTLTAPGHDTICETFLPQDDDDTVISTTCNNLDASVGWTVEAVSYDHNDSVLHKGSIDFDVKAADTVDVSLDLKARFQIVAVVFTGFNDSGTTLSLLIDSAVVTDTTLEGDSDGDSTVLKYEYLPVTIDERSFHLSLTVREAGEEDVATVKDTNVTSTADGDLSGLVITHRNIPEKNQPPKFISKPDDMRSAITAGSIYLDTVFADDGNHDSLVFRLSEYPEDMECRDGIIQWNPTAEDTGSHTITIVVNDGNDLFDTLSWTIEVKQVSPENHPPEFTVSSSDLRSSVVAGSVYSDTVAAADPDGDTISFILKKAPAGMTIQNAVVRWIPTSDEAGTHSIVTVADDGNGGLDTLTWNITVEPGDSTNRAPVFSTIIADLSKAFEFGTEYKVTLEVSDPNGDAVTLQLLENPGGMKLEGTVIQWKPVFEDVGVHTVKVMADDGRGGTSELLWSVRVTEIVDNHPPVFISTPDDMNITIAAGTLYFDTIAVQDQDVNDEVRLMFMNASSPEGIHISGHSIGWTIPRDINGGFTISILAVDRQYARDTLTYTILVTPGAAEDTLSLFLSREMEGTIIAGHHYLHAVPLKNSNDEVIAVKLLEGPDSMRLPSNNRIVWNTRKEDVGLHVIRITASDTTGRTDTLSWVLEVIANIPPLFFTDSKDMRDTITVENIYREKIDCFDPDAQDDNDFTLSFIEKPDEMTLTGTSFVYWYPTFSDTGVYTVSLQIIDHIEDADTLTWTIRVKPAAVPNRPPEFTSQPSDMKSIAYHEYWFYDTLRALDPDNDKITFSLKVKPAAMQLLNDSIVTWQPFLRDTGQDHSITAIVDDGRLCYDTLQWTVRVQPNEFFTDVTFDSLITGAVPFNTKVSRFHFQGNVDDAVSTLISWNNNVETYIRFTGPSDESLFAGNVKTFNDRQIRAPIICSATGTYTMAIECSSYGTEKPYSFVMYSRAEQLAASPVVQFGTSYSDTLTTGIEMHSYHFNATQGDQVCLYAITDDFLPVEMGIVDAAHNNLGVYTVFTNRFMVYQDTIGIPSTGSNLLLIRSVEDKNTVNLTFAVNSRMAQRAASPELVYGTPHSDSILNPVQFNSYTFNGTQDDSVTLFAQCDSGKSALVTLYDPSFSIVMPERTFGASGYNSTLMLPATGTYLVQIRTENIVMPVPYQVRVSDEN